MTEYHIEKNIPVPEDFTTGSWSADPLPLMEIGDSVFAPCDLSASRNLTPKRFVSRLVTEHGERGVRIWRIE